jgi:hypothetical protein
VTEYGDEDESKGIAAVGKLDYVSAVEFRMGIELDPQKLTMGECVSLGAYPGTGKNRAERVKNALNSALEAKNEVDLA